MPDQPGQEGKRSRVFETVLQSPAIHIECFKDLVDVIGRDSTAHGPEYDVQVFLAGLQLIEYRIEEISAGNELALKETEVATVKFDPEVLTLQMFHPPCSEITRPVPFHPLPDAAFSQIVACLLGLDPLVSVLFFDTRLVDASSGDWTDPVVRLRKRVITMERAIHGHHLRGPSKRTHRQLSTLNNISKTPFRSSVPDH
jgi:hypothetical protein